MTKINNPFIEFNPFFNDLKQQLRRVVAHQIEAKLEQDIDEWLYRSSHKRRRRVGQRRTSARCCRCKSHQARDFLRNGHRKRQLLTSYGVVDFWLPRVVCSCGGSVQIPFSIIQPYQRLWDDVVEQISRWAQLGISLRQMQTEIGDHLGTQVGLRTLNEVVHCVKCPTAIELTSVPPIVMLDAIWVTLLQPTGEVKFDLSGRHRPGKTVQDVCVLVALGLYPQSGRWGILAWALAESENQSAWESLLLPLEQRGLHRQRGLELFIHDGAKGVIAALDFLHPHIPHQRCLFHKLRNLWHAISPPAGQSSAKRQQFKRELIQQVLPIFSAHTLQQAHMIRDQLVAQWQADQPQFVTTLLRDWHETVAFFRVLQRFPHWPRRCLRTTSLLERVNRMIRRLFRSAATYHSAVGLLAAVARVLLPFRLT